VCCWDCTSTRHKPSADIQIFFTACEKYDQLDPGLLLLADGGVSVEDGHDDLTLDVREKVEVDELRVRLVLMLALLLMMMMLQLLALKCHH